MIQLQCAPRDHNHQMTRNRAQHWARTGMIQSVAGAWTRSAARRKSGTESNRYGQASHQRATTIAAIRTVK